MVPVGKLMMDGAFYVRRVLHPKKYVSLRVLCDYVGLGTENFSDSVKAVLDKTVWQMCVEGLPSPHNGVWYVWTQRGADFAMSKKPLVLISQKQYADYPCIVVDNPLEIYTRMCHFYRRMNKRVVATVVTGSIGKTTTSEMLASVYLKYTKTYFSWDNDNDFQDISYKVQHIPTHWKRMVQEVGEDTPNVTQWNSLMVYPSAAVITKIDNSHFEAFGSFDNIVTETCEVVKGLQPNAPVFVTKGEFQWYDRLEGHPVITVSDSDSTADYYAKDIKVTQSGLSFVAVDNVKHTEHSVKLTNIYARHNALAALRAFAVGCHEGIPYNKIVAGLESYRTRNIRQNVVWTNDGVCLYVDCYNAIASSVKSSVEAAEQIPIAGRRIAVLGDIEECGEMADAQHTECVEIINQSTFDALIAVGEKMSAAMERYPNRDNLTIFACKDRHEATRCLKNYVKSGDQVLFKSSHSGHLSDIAKSIWPETSDILMNDAGRHLRWQKYISAIS